MRILLAEDNALLARSLRRGLEEEGFLVDLAVDGEEGQRLADANTYDAIILDLMLPKVDGLTLLQRWRAAGLKTHVLVLTARDSLDDKLRGLNLGADDYLTKPFDLAELLARIRALGRRSLRAADPVIRVQDLEIDTASRMARRAGQPLRLTPREFALLELLATHPGEVVSKQNIIDCLYDENEEMLSNSVEVHVSTLRKKVDRDFSPALIQTVRGMGYTLAAPTPESRNEPDTDRL